METVEEVRRGVVTGIAPEAVRNLVKASARALLKEGDAKMGISTVLYRGAQIFEASASQVIVDTWFTGRPRSSAASASTSSPREQTPRRRLSRPSGIPPGGPMARRRRRRYQWRPRAAPPFNPEHRLPPPARHALGPLRHLQRHLAWTTQSKRLMTLRGLFSVEGRRAPDPVPIEEVEPVPRS